MPVGARERRLSAAGVPDLRDSPDADGTRSIRARLGWFALASACLAADLWTKHLVFYPEATEPGFREGLIVRVIAPWWRTILVYNPGVTFGALGGVPGWVKAALTSAVIVAMAWKLWKARDGRPVESLSLAMIVGGAVGNLYDRTLRPVLEPDTRPGVRDFLDWHIPDGSGLAEAFRERGWETHWYTSNVADVLIVCGVILLAWCLLRHGDDDGEPVPASPPAAAPPTSAGVEP